MSTTLPPATSCYIHERLESVKENTDWDRNPYERESKMSAYIANPKAFA